MPLELEASGSIPLEVLSVGKVDESTKVSLDRGPVFIQDMTEEELWQLAETALDELNEKTGRGMVLYEP
jgi:hypothetical protein